MKILGEKSLTTKDKIIKFFSINSYDNNTIKDLTNTTNEYQREMIENTYKELEKDKTNRIEQLQKLLEQHQEDLDTEKIKKLKTAIEYFDDILKSNEPNRYILECLIDKIWIYHDKSVKFELKPEISRLI